ncbi:hypothetical protein PAXRUDRAFT_164976 [Paxillus rubicundulus Ve08.2h10]|uniref:Uncharacterized protein n=1 Tax=Paxillus rubicundulus Ve08.2h10 TaxID=930991 RepID=A0A0D0DIY1_9AGAM|nr:hypothetical protein PAXRUDRAFT_164976 [Paxillus rubicundulus Ve08.2h10]
MLHTIIKRGAYYGTLRYGGTNSAFQVCITSSHEQQSELTNASAVTGPACLQSFPNSPPDFLYLRRTHLGAGIPPLIPHSGRCFPALVYTTVRAQENYSQRTKERKSLARSSLNPAYML